MVRGIVAGDFIPTFFASVRKVPGNLKGALAAVTMTEAGIKLIYDIDFMDKATDEQIDHVLSHELLHVTNFHFLRGDDLMNDLKIPKLLFQLYYIPMADAPVNWSLKDMPGANPENSFTYDSLPKEVTYNSHPTFENIVHYMYENHPPDENMVMISMGQGGGDEQQQGGQSGDSSGNKVVLVNADGSAQVLKEGDGPTITVPEIKQGEATERFEEDIKEMIEESMKTAGRMSSELKRALEHFLDECSKPVLKGWSLLQHFLNGYRTINKGTKRVMRRLNRRTLLPPGKVRIKGFRVLFIVDESGSMSDEEVSLSLGLCKKCIKRENSDKLYYIHWDTQMLGEVEEIKTQADIDDIKRDGCGGTDFTTMFADETVRSQDVDLYVIVTDGYPCGWPEDKSPVPQVWIVTQQGGYESWKEQYNQGLAVCVQE